MVDIEKELRKRELQLKQREVQLQQLIAKEERRRRISQNLIAFVGAIFAIVMVFSLGIWDRMYASPRERA
jgi:hypothetical protein